MSKKILIVDDSSSNVLLLKNFLEAEGFMTLSAEDGAGALQLIKQELPDAVLLDLMMPEVDGYDVLDELKSNDAIKNIPVILISASKEKDAAAKALKKGAVAFLCKPIDFDTILSELEKVL